MRGSWRPLSALIGAAFPRPGCWGKLPPDRGMHKTPDKGGTAKMTEPTLRLAGQVLCALLILAPLSATAQESVATAAAQPVKPTATSPTPEVPADDKRGPVTNLPLPRYVSLKGSEGNARRGPSLSHRVDWVFRHAGMALRITAEYGQWRRVEDRDGAGGWVHYSLLSGVRTAVVRDELVELHSRSDPESAIRARAEAGAVVKLDGCTPDWCEITGGGVSGWVPKTALWGVDPEETRD